MADVNDELEPTPDTVQDVQVADDLDTKSHRMSIEDGLRASFEAAEKAEAEPEKEKEKPAIKQAKGEKPRATDGKFVAAEGAEKAPAADATQKSSKTDDTEAPKVEPQITSAPTAAPPNSWSKEAKALWSTLPPSIQAEAHKREADMARGVEQLKQRYADIETVMAPRQHLLQQAGKSAGQAIGQMWQWHDMLSHADPAYRFHAITQLARDYGININQTPQAQQFAGQPQYQQPDITQAIAPILAPVYSQVDILGRTLQQLQDERLHNEIESFAQAKDATGNPLHPHFDMAREYMAKVLNKGMVDTLDGAYQMAMRNDDGLIAAANAQQETKAAEAKAKADAEKQKADAEQKRKLATQTNKARNAAVSPRVGAPSGSSQPARKKMTVEESLREAFNAVDQPRV